MMSDISLFLKNGWKNMWKEKILWLFSSLALIYPLILLIFRSQKNLSLSLACLELVLGLIGIFFLYLSAIAVAYVSYLITARNTVNVQRVLQVVKKVFWRVVVAIFFFLLFFVVLFAVCAGLVFMVFGMSFPIPQDFRVVLFFISIGVSISSAPWSFLLAEIVVKDSSIWKSMENAWDLFIDHFVVLAVIGFILWIAGYAVDITIGIATTLIQNNFDFTVLHGINFMSPYTYFLNNKLYYPVTVIFGILRNTYAASIFMLAYLKYGA